MTTGPTDVKVTTAAGGPDGMPLALKFNEGLGAWQPIETVPLNKRVLFWWRPIQTNPHAECCVIGKMSSYETGKWWTERGEYQDAWHVTRWMLLPPPPQDASDAPNVF